MNLQKIYDTFYFNHRVKSFTFLVFLWGLGLSFNTVYAQQNKNTLITADFNNKALFEVILSIESQTDLRFYFKTEWIEEYSITKSFKGITPEDVLNEILKDTKLTYIQISNTIYLIPKEDVALILKNITNTNGYKKSELTDYVIIGNENESGKHKIITIKGVVSDGATGAVLIGSNVVVENTNFYTITDKTGAYSIEIPTGIYKLRVTSFGYEDKKMDIKAISPASLNVEMFEKSYSLDEVVISTERKDINVSRNQMSTIELNAKTIKELPSLIGEKDIIKSLTTLPGVKSVGEFGSGINVRGGGEYQNLYLLENSVIYNTSHVLGLLSVINPDAVNKVTLYKGHVPIEYGERVSSVMDIEIQDKTINKFSCKGGIGIYSSRLLMETPLFNKLITVKLGVRSSYSDYLLQRFPDYNLQNSSAGFYDLTGVINLRLKNNPINLFGYLSSDKFRYSNDFIYDYGNRLLSFNWNHSFYSGLNSRLIASYSKYYINNQDIQNEIFANKVFSSTESVSIKFITEYNEIERNQIKAGGQFIRYCIIPGNRLPIGISQSQPLDMEPENGYEYSFFASDEITLTSRLFLNIGGRYTIYKYLGEKTIYSYEDGKPKTLDNVRDSSVFSKIEKITAYDGFEPRLSFKYMLTASSSLKFSYNKSYQYISLLSYTSISTPEDIWKLSDPFLKPIESNQLALGYYQNFMDNELETSVEIYYKTLNNLTEYRNGAQLKLNNHVETELLNARGKNFGIELLIKKSYGKLNGSVAYTYSKALKQTNGKFSEDMINLNKQYPSQYDVPHDFNLSLNYRVNKRVRFGASFTYTSGRPITLPEYMIRFNNEKLVFYSDRNKYRLPAYHRMDISLNIDESLKKKKKWKGSWNISILNVYARKNAYSIYYQKDTPSAANDYRAFSLYKMYLIGLPLPTVSYNFIF